MEFADIQAQLPALLAVLLGCSCQWRTQPLGMVVGTTATVDWLAGSTVGQDEHVTTDVDAAGVPTDVDADIAAVTETVYGLREATVQVTVWSADQRLDKSARAALEQLRTRLSWTSSVASLKALGLALVDAGPITPGDSPSAGRLYSQASIDLRVAYGVAETDAPIPFIETARATSAIEDAAGDPLPASIQIDVDGS